ncbi:MAG: hypothetical protein E7395_06760 [Ruminococcaceae bacterium]|nr:hypothetical protein [Oscillospiraceae bacterium]
MDIEIDDISIPDGIQILGKEGIECYYTLSNGVVTKVETKADICVDISQIYTAVSDKFNGFNTLSVTTGDNCTYLDGNATPIGEVMNINGSTYVNSSLFTRVFGWELGYAAHDMLSNAYEYTFYTDVP